jgi:hypothetical protein
MSLHDRVSSRVAVCWLLGLVAAGAAALMWWVPWTAYDSRCSLATRNHEHVRGACADGAAALMPWFVVVAVAAVALVVIGTIVAVRGRR